MTAVGVSRAAQPGLTFVVATYPECAEVLIAFRNRNRSTSRDRVYFDWRYLARPCALKPVIVWAEAEGRRVGALSIVPHDYHVVDTEYPVGVLGDISVLPEFRGHGVAGGMFGFLPQVEALQSLHGCMVLPNEDAARPLAKSGWKDVQRLQRFVRFFDFAPRLSRLIRSPMLANRIAMPLNWLMRRFSLEQWYRRDRRYRGTPISGVDERFDNLWRQADKRGKIIGVRNQSYLNWRYRLHPLDTHHIFALTESDRLCGYVIYRREYGTCYVQDVFCADDRSLPSHLLGLFIGYLRDQHGVTTVSVGINGSFLALPWRTFGFIRRADYQRVMVSGFKPGGRTKTEDDVPKWHVTAGDKDV